MPDLGRLFWLSMNSNRLILIIATVFSLMANIPRVLFLLSGKNDPTLNSVIEVTPEDTIFRILLLFSFSYLILSANITWVHKFQARFRIWVTVGVNAFILLAWLTIFHMVDNYVYSIYDAAINRNINGIVYFFFTLLLVLISTAVNLVNRSKLDAIEKEVLKQKSLQNELEALRNQINPHFLFNSLNTLSLLVREDQKAATTFINKLSFLFRYILQSRDKELVTVQEELKVAESYVHLIRQRYRQNFHVNIRVAEHMLQRKIPVLALQLLLENAVKHNEISDKKPLTVDIFDSDDRIVVQNPLQERTGHVESTNTGLSNLNSRVKLQMKKEIQISKNDSCFTVRIPTA